MYLTGTDDVPHGYISFLRMFKVGFKVAAGMPTSGLTLPGLERGGGCSEARIDGKSQG